MERKYKLEKIIKEKLKKDGVNEKWLEKHLIVEDERKKPNR
tara:strand:- start:435 stop:557 length:123 start_codon:yes stop_codon:yes gene_type:complete